MPHFAVQHGEVLGGVAHAHAALVLTEGHVEQPVDLILDAPMAPNRLPESLGRQRRAQQVGARFALALAVAPAPFGFHHANRA